MSKSSIYWVQIERNEKEVVLINFIMDRELIIKYNLKKNMVKKNFLIIKNSEALLNKHGSGL